MLRVVISFLFLLCALTPLLSRAEGTLQLRASEKAGYSRLVLDWGKIVPYQLTQTEPGKLDLHFSEPGSIDNPGVKAVNVLGVTIVSQAPLELSIKIPDKATARDFQAGNRIILDIYDPPGTKRATPPKTSEAVPPKPEPVKQAEAKPPEKPPEKIAEKAAEKPPEKPKQEKILTQAPPAVKADVEPVVGADLVPQVQASLPAEEGTLQSALPDTPPTFDNRPSNLITISAIDALGLAVFERDGGIWLVADKDNMMLAPQVSGPDAKYFLPIDTFDVEGGKIFRVRSMDNARIRGQGGGLLWRVVVPAGPPKIQPTRAQRIDENPDDARGGKIVWPFGDARRIFKISDPVTGKNLYAVTVGSAKRYAGAPLKFVDFDTLESPVGLVILPKVDDLDIAIDSNGDVVITRPNGLAVTSQEKIAALEEADKKKIQPGSQINAKRIFDFQNWQMGGLESMDQNRNLIMTNIGSLEGSDRVQGILTLAKMYLSNGMWAEAKGFLDLAQDEMPELNQNPAFTAMHGAAQALGWESESAFEQLSVEELKPYPEIGYWRAYALADLGDWQQADQVFPDELYILSQYPPIIRTRLSLVLAEVALRAGDTAKGEQLLGFADEFRTQLKPQQMAAMNYLKGEASRQRKKIDETKKVWKSLSKGSDDLYRAKAGLALTRLLEDKKELSPEKAIDNLERLRYAWRGDELEAQIAYWLGRTYFEHSDYVKGLIIMRDAASYAADTDVGKKIISEMTDVFKKLFLGPELDKISALDAAALHEQFLPYMPESPETDKIAERLAERLVKADLLEKAAQLLEAQLSHLTPPEAYRVEVRLAAIHLLDGKPAKALTILDKALETYALLPVELKGPEKEMELALLRARAMSDQDRFEQALALLNGLPHTPEVNVLRADIAWHAGYWDDAAQALEEVILDRDVSTTRPLEGDNTALILQRAVALNLSGDRVGLATLRGKFMDAMSQTDKARIFEVVTRPRQSAALADRKTLMGIVSEVDLFKDFLQSYKADPSQQAAAEPVKPETAPAPAAEAAPAAGEEPPAALPPESQ